MENIFRYVSIKIHQKTRVHLSPINVKQVLPGLKNAEVYINTPYRTKMQIWHIVIWCKQCHDPDSLPKDYNFTTKRAVLQVMQSKNILTVIYTAFLRDWHHKIHKSRPFLSVIRTNISEKPAASCYRTFFRVPIYQNTQHCIT